MLVVPAAEPTLLEGIAFCLERNAHDLVDGFRRVAIYRCAARCGADVDRCRYVDVVIDDVLHISHAIEQRELSVASNRASKSSAGVKQFMLRRDSRNQRQPSAAQCAADNLLDA